MEWQPVSHDLQSSTIQCIGNSHVEVTDEDVRCHPSARFATYPCGCTLQSKPSPSQDSCSGTSCTVVAKGVEWTATPAVAPRKGQGKTKAAKEEDPEQLRLNPGLHVARRRAESHPSSWATLRAHQRQLTVRKKWEVLRHSEILFHAGRGLVLPSTPLCPRFEVLWSSWRRSKSTSQCRPRRHDKTRNPCQPIRCISSCVQTNRVRMFFQPSNDGVGDRWVTLSYHGQTVCPAGPISAQNSFSLHCASPVHRAQGRSSQLA